MKLSLSERIASVILSSIIKNEEILSQSEDILKKYPIFDIITTLAKLSAIASDTFEKSLKAFLNKSDHNENYRDILAMTIAEILHTFSFDNDTPIPRALEIDYSNVQNILDDLTQIYGDGYIVFLAILWYLAKRNRYANIGHLYMAIHATITGNQNFNDQIKQIYLN